MPNNTNADANASVSALPGVSYMSANTLGHSAQRATITMTTTGTARKTAVLRRTLATSAVLGAALIPLMVAPRQANAQSPNTPNGQFLGVVGVMPYRSQELQFCQVTISNSATAIGCSGTVPANATVAYIMPESQALRCRGDGTAPTATVGQPVAVSSQMTYAAQPLGNLQCIAQSGAATVDEWFFR